MLGRTRALVLQACKTIALKRLQNRIDVGKPRHDLLYASASFPRLDFRQAKLPLARGYPWLKMLSCTTPCSVMSCMRRNDGQQEPGQLADCQRPPPRGTHRAPRSLSRLVCDLWPGHGLTPRRYACGVAALARCPGTARRVRLP